MGRRLPPFRWSAPLVLLLLAGAGCATTPAMREPGTPDGWRAAMQPPLADDVAQALADEPTLALAVAVGAERNPTVAALRERWFAAIHVAPQVVAPPDPMLSAGYQFKNVETRVGPQQASIGLMQPIPWPQKLWARGKAALIGADVAELQYEAALRDLIVDVKGAYYELYYLDQALPITEKIEGLLRNDAILAYSELTVGRTQLNEAFRAESQAAQLGYDRILLTELRAAQVERLKALLNLPPETVIGPVRQAPVYTVAPDVDALYERAEDYAEVLKIRGLEVQRAAYDTFLARLSRIPDISVGFNYIPTDQARVSDIAKYNYLTAVQSNITAIQSGTGMVRPPTPLRPGDSGKDPFIGLLQMNLPIYEWRNRALIREQKALEEAMRLEAMGEVNQVRAGVAEAYFAARLTERLVELYAGTLLPQAEAVMQQAEVFFRNEQASFANVLETTLAYHNFLLAYHRARADHGQAIGLLERVVGTTAEPRLESEAEPVVTPEGAVIPVPATEGETAPSPLPVPRGETREEPTEE